MSEHSENLPLDQPKQPLEPESSNPESSVGTIRANYSELANSGLAFSRDNKGGMDHDTYDRYRSTWSQLGDKASGPESAGVDGAGESRKQ